MRALRRAGRGSSSAIPGTPACRTLFPRTRCTDIPATDSTRCYTGARFASARSQRRSVGRDEMGRVMGFEPTTPGTTIRCSNRLSYTRHRQLHLVKPRCRVKRPAAAADRSAGATARAGAGSGSRRPDPFRDGIRGDAASRRRRRSGRPGARRARDDRGGAPGGVGGRRPHPRSGRRRHRRGDRGADGAGAGRAAVVGHRRRRFPALLRCGAGTRDEP